MKKHVLALLFVGLLSAPAVYAEAIPSDGGIDVVGGTGAVTCSMLGSAVRINLSSGVLGAFECNSVANSVAVATCHSSGSRVGKLLDCKNYAAEGETAVWNDASCASGGIMVDGVASNKFQGAGYTGYKAVSSGGGVGGNDLGDTCNANSVDALVGL